MPDDRTLVVLSPEEYGRLVTSRERLRAALLHLIAFTGGGHALRGPGDRGGGGCLPTAGRSRSLGGRVVRRGGGHGG